jgi:hypothetical protein
LERALAASVIAARITDVAITAGTTRERAE